MAQKSTLLAAASAAVLGLMAAPAIADVDRLPAERVTAIQVAFDQVLSDPEAHVDALSDARLALIVASYDSLPYTPDADTLPPARWAAMQEAYTTHDPDFARVAVLAD